MIEANLFLDYDNTQIAGHLHNAVFRALKRGDLPRGYRNSNDVINVINENEELPKEVGKWLDVQIKKNGIVFFDLELLAEKVKEYRRLEVDTYVLTASRVPGAISHMYKKEGLGELFPKMRIITVPIEDADIHKADVIDELERRKESTSTEDVTVSIFIDDSKKNTDAVDLLPQKDGVFRLVCRVNKDGLCKETFDTIDLFLNKVGVTVDIAQNHSPIRDFKDDSLLRKLPELPSQREDNVKTVYENTPDEIEKARESALMKESTLREEASGISPNRKEVVKTVYENTPDEIEKARESALMKESTLREEASGISPNRKEVVKTVYENTPDEIEKAHESALMKESTLREEASGISPNRKEVVKTVYENTPDEIENARQSALIKRNIIEKVLKKINRRYGGLQDSELLSQMEVEEISESVRLNLHKGDVDFSFEKLEDIVGLERIRSTKNPDGRLSSYSAGASHPMSGMTQPNIQRSEAALNYATKSEQTILQQKDIVKNTVSRRAIRKK